MQARSYGRCVAALRASEGWVLTCLRLATEEARNGTGNAPTCDEGLAVAGLPPLAAEALRAAIGIMTTAALRYIDVRNLGSSEVSRDEERFLLVVHALQHGDEFTGRRILRDWLAPAGARLVLLYLETVGAAMICAGLRVPAPPMSGCPMVSLAKRRLAEMEAAAMPARKSRPN